MLKFTSSKKIQIVILFLIVFVIPLAANYDFNFPSEELVVSSISGNADAVVDGHNPGGNVFLGPPDNNSTHIWNGAFTTLDLTDVIPAGESINITLGHIWNTNGLAHISSSANATSGFGDLETYGIGTNPSVTIPSGGDLNLATITYTASVPVRYIKIAVINENIQLDAISYDFSVGCGLNITSASARNCSGSGPYVADVEVIFEYSNEPAGDIMYQTNTDAPIAFTPNSSPDTILLSGIPADSGFDEIKIFFDTENTCGDTVIVNRLPPCPFGLEYRGPGQMCEGMPDDKIGGSVFVDWNYDGVMNQIDTSGVSGIAVYLYDDCSNFKDTVSTDSNGNFLFENLTVAGAYRVEFEIPTALADQYSMTKAGPDNGGAVQFVTAGDCANLGVSAPGNYCQDNPPLATTCFVAGDMSWHSSTSPILVSIDYNSGTTSQDNNANLDVTYTSLGDLGTVGSIYGIAYSRKEDAIYSSAFFKMVSEFPNNTFGSDDPSIIYKTSGARSGAASTAPWVTLTGVNSAGTDPFTAATTSGTIWAGYADDALTNSVGRLSFGDIELSLDETYLYAWNLYNRKLYEIRTSDGGVNNSFDIPSGISVGTNPGDCPDQADLIPGAVKVHPQTGALYIGITCNCESNGDASKLRAYVYELDPTDGSSAERLNIPLNYDRSRIGTEMEHPNPGSTNNWNAWTTTLDTDNLDDTNPPFFDNGSSLFYYPQPWLLDLDFDEQNFMVLAINDRFGNQFGPGAPSNGGYSAGDILIAAPNDLSTSWMLENNGIVGAGDSTRTKGTVYATTANDRGPGGAEFFYHDRFGVNADGTNDGVHIAHSEITNGGVFIIPGAGEVVSGCYDPAPVDDGNNYGSGGLIYLSTRDGSRTRSAKLYSGWPAFGKANGIGDIEALCDEAPLEIGQYIWADVDSDGIHDACESGLAGVNVQLFDDSGVLLATTTSDPDGQYYFSADGAANQTWVVSNDGIEKNTDYFIVVGDTQFSNGKLTIGGADYQLTQDSVDNGEANPFLHDSNGEIILLSPANTFDNMPAAFVSTGAAGKVDHSISFGFMPAIENPTVLGNRVWLDENSDGVQDIGEPGIPGVVVALNDIGGSTIATRKTDADGGYLFTGLNAGSFTVVIQSGLPTGMVAVYDEDGMTASPDGSTAVTIAEGAEYMTADFGYNFTSVSDTDLPDMTDTGAFGDRIWNDANGDGVQDQGESGIANVTVSLYNDANADGVYDNLVGTTTTNQYGNYIFDNLVPDAYVVAVDDTSLPAHFGTTPSGDPDSDSNNTSKPIVVAPGDVVLIGDFGYQPTGVFSIGDLVFLDIDGDGIQDSGEPGIPNVSLALQDASGEVMATTTTLADGTYSFPGLMDGTYKVVITDTENLLGELAFISDPDGVTDGVSEVVIAGADNDLQDFGLAPQGHATGDGLIGDQIFLDINNSNTFDVGEGIEQVRVDLFDIDGVTLLDSTTTDENGRYYFGGLFMGGAYVVKVDETTLPGGAVYDNHIDADGDSPGNGTSTVDLAMTTTGFSLDQDFGYKAATPVSISGTIWEDTNADGTFDGAETELIGGVMVSLTDANHNIIATTMTDVNGDYSFSNIPAGIYVVSVQETDAELLGYWHSLGTDSEPSSTVVDASTASVADVDFGYYQNAASIGNYVWDDVNMDGLQDAVETGIENVLVTLEIDYNGDGTAEIAIVDTTDATGHYSFDNLLLDEDYAASGTVKYTVSVATPFSYTPTTTDVNTNGNDQQDADDPTGVAATVTQGNENTTTNADPTAEYMEASYDFGFVYLNTTHAVCDFNNTPYETSVVGDVTVNDRDDQADTQVLFALVGANGGMPAGEGTVVFNADGTYLYTPPSGYSGETSFTYEVCDDGAPVACDTTMVFIEVLPPVSVEGGPIIANPDANLIESGTTGIGNVISNDFDPDDRPFAISTTLNAVTVSGVDEDGEVVADAGTLTLSADGSYVFVPTGSFTGVVLQPYTISTASTPAVTDDSALEITVIADLGNATFANDDAEVTDIGVAVSNDVISNDTDPEGDTELISSYTFDSDGDGDTETPGTVGTATQIGGNDASGAYVANAGDLTLNTDGTYLFEPTSTFVGNVIITYAKCDNITPTPACDTATLVITIMDVQRDFGDAPANYPVAWHRAMTDIDDPVDNILDGATDVWLGSKAGFESSQLSSSSATGDTHDDAIAFGSGAGQFPMSTVPDTDYDVNIVLNGNADGDVVYYGMWIDWDADGYYEDFYAGSGVTNSPVTVVSTITSPSGYSPVIVNVRLRADDDPLVAADSTGGKTNGEVEDYQVVVSLPVELISFEGRAIGCDVQLNWSAAIEENFGYYEVERSDDGRTFSKVGKIQNDSYSSSDRHYHFLDQNTIDRNYYRLKMVDLDGSFEYSKTIFVETSCGIHDFNIYPNPIGKGTGTLNVDFFAEKTEVKFEIRDMLNRVVKKISFETIEKRNNRVVWDVSDLPSGTYFMYEVQSRKTRKFVIQE